MSKGRFNLAWVFVWALVMNLGFSAEGKKSDTGREVEVVVYHGSDEKGFGKSEVRKDVQERLKKVKPIAFNHYREIGRDRQPLLKTGESIAKPVKAAGVIEVRFEARGQVRDERVVLDLELWQGGKKILKTDAEVDVSKPFYVLGSGYRGGRLIVEIVLAKPVVSEKK